MNNKSRHRNCKIEFEKLYIAETDTGELWIGRVRDGLPDGEVGIFKRELVEKMLLEFYENSF